MTCGEILETLRTDKPSLDKYGVTKIAVFGSMARGEGGFSGATNAACVVQSPHSCPQNPTHRPIPQDAASANYARK